MVAELWQWRKQKQRRRILSGVAVLLSAAALIGGVFAYFTSRQQMMNTMSVGQNITRIEESFDPNPDREVYKKAVQIANTGNVPCYVRVYVAFSDEETAEISQFSSDGKSYYPVSKYAEHLPDGWAAGSDGYLYYEKVLLPGEKTSRLISNVKTLWRADMERHDFDLIVREESVQVPVNQPDAGYKAAWAGFHAGEVN